MKFEINILGCGSATPTVYRKSTSQVINVQEQYFMIDCGEGTQIQLRKFKLKFQKIDHLFISHLHGDHCLGVMGLISSMHLLGRTKPFYIYAPPELEEIIHLQLKASKSYLNFDLNFHSIDPNGGEKLLDNKIIKVHSIKLKHRIDTCGFLIQEKVKERNVRKELIKELDLKIEEILQIKKGEDLQRGDEIIPNANLILPPIPPRSYAYCSDTAYFPSIIPQITGVTALYHESTFLEEMKDRAKKTMHSTAKQAATIAKEAKVGKLILGHYSARYRDASEFKVEAQEIFENVYLAEDGVKIEL